MFVWLYNLLGMLLYFFNSFTGSYAISLLLYALFFKLLLLFFNIKQQKNQIKMAKLTPKIEVIKAKYKGRKDQPTMQKMQQEIMELQQKEGASPFAGCLPLLLQLPIILLLYAVIQNPLSYIAKTSAEIDAYNEARESLTADQINADERFEDIRYYYDDIIFKTEDGKQVATGKEITKTDIVFELYKEFINAEATELPDNSEIGLISEITKRLDGRDEIGKADLKATVTAIGIDYNTIPNFHLFGLDLSGTPGQVWGWLILIPILAAGFSWLSMWLTRKMNKTGIQSEQDAQTQKSMMVMDLVMPLMTFFIALNMPGVMGVYWIYQSLLGLAISFILAKAMPLPKFTEEDLKEIKKAQREAEKAQKEIVKSQAKHRSLHYIDEDDYEELPEVAGKTSDDSSKNKSMNSDMPEIKD